MLKAPHKKAHGSHGRIATYIFLYSIISATLLIINKAAVVRFPYPNTVLLLQLSCSAAFAALLGKLGLAEVDELSWSNIEASIPVSASFFLGVFTSINALHHVNVDTMIVLKTATPIMVAVGEWLCLSYAMPSLRTWAALSCVVMTTAASLSLQFSSITSTGLVWVVSWFGVVVFNMVYSSYYVQTVKLTAMGRVLCENLIAAVPAAAMAAAWEWSPKLLPALWSSGGVVVLVSCLFGLGMSWFGWALRQEVSALTYTVVGVLTKLITVVLNATMWARHGPAGSSFLLALGICASSLYQQPPKLPKQKRAMQQRLGGILAGLVGTLLLVRAGLGLGNLLYSGPVTATLETTLRVIDAEKKVILHQMDVERHALAQQLEQFSHLGNPTYAAQQERWQQQQHHRHIHLGGAAAAARAGAGVPSGAGYNPDIAAAVIVRPDTPSSSSSSPAAAAVQSSPAGAAAAAAGGEEDASPAALAAASPAAVQWLPSAAAAAAAVGPITREEIVAAAQQPIRVALMTGTFFGIGHGRPEPNCTYEGVPLDCRVQGGPTAEFRDTADALYYHIPSHGGSVPPRAHSKQLRLAVDLEPAAYYRHMNDPNYMCQFDAEFTYRLCSQVVNFYSLHLFGDMDAPPVPWEQKEHALVYINSNCGAMSGRAAIMKELMALPGAKVPVHSMGNCDRNRNMPAGQNKLQTFTKYKFCVAMENSINQDYVSEKVMDALRAGCVPIYLGAPNIRAFLPVPWAVIMYGPGGNATTPAELDALMERVGRDKELYDSLLAWKTMPVSQYQPVFHTMHTLAGQSGECRLCQFLMHHRLRPQPHYTTCLFNQTWMQEAKQDYVPWPAGCTADSSGSATKQQAPPVPDKRPNPKRGSGAYRRTGR